MRFWRSLLFTPALAEKRWRSAHLRGADAVIVDLEDSIPASQKEAARRGAIEAVNWLAGAGATVTVRVNNDPINLLPDLDAIAATPVEAIILPKVSGAGDLAAVGDALAQRRSAATGLIAVIEDPSALERLGEIAEAPGVTGLALGSEDFSLSMGCEPALECLGPALSAIAYASAARGLMAIGMACGIGDYSDIGSWTREARRARRMGATGAMAIHPAQIAALNDAFAPSEQELHQARAVIAAFEAAEGGVVVLDGHMIDRPVVERARRLVERAGG
jgi:citrate lyase subunit beta/citryl-CoA lyase